ncbi:MAG: hypothetical protein H7843_15635 [Nitrospirota bacterium]
MITLVLFSYNKIMPVALPIEIYDLLEKKVGREEAREVGKILTASLDAIEKKDEAVAIQKKAEIKDELTKELATKEDLAKLEGRLNEKVTTIEGRLNERLTAIDWKLKLYFLILIFVTLLTNKDALVIIGRLTGLIK